MTREEFGQLVVEFVERHTNHDEETIIVRDDVSELIAAIEDREPLLFEPEEPNS